MFPVAGHLSGKKHVKSHLGTAWLLAWRRALVLSSFVFPSSPGTERTCRGLKARACYALKRKAGFGPHKKLHFNPQTNWPIQNLLHGQQKGKLLTQTLSPSLPTSVSQTCLGGIRSRRQRSVQCWALLGPSVRAASWSWLSEWFWGVAACPTKNHAESDTLKQSKSRSQNCWNRPEQKQQPRCKDAAAPEPAFLDFILLNEGKIQFSPILKNKSHTHLLWGNLLSDQLWRQGVRHMGKKLPDAAPPTYLSSARGRDHLLGKSRVQSLSTFTHNREV